MTLLLLFPGESKRIKLVRDIIIEDMYDTEKKETGVRNLCIG